MSEQQKTRKIGISFALKREESWLRKLLEDSHVPAEHKNNITVWYARNVELLVTVSGMGQDRSRQATELLITAGAEVIVCAGLAAGIAPEARVGDVAIASRVLLFRDLKSQNTEQPIVGVKCSPTHNSAIQCSESVIAMLPPSGALGFPIRLCDLVTADHIVCARDEKARINKQTFATALDMESYACGEICAISGVPFAAIRAICDTADQDLPAVICAIASATCVSGFQIPKLRSVALAISSPHSWLSLLRLHSQAQVAIRNLGEVLATMIVRMS